MMAKWRQPARAEARPVDWVAVALFWGVACGWSWLAAHWTPLALPATAQGYKVDNSILVGFGPALGALVAGWLRPNAAAPRTTSLLGHVPWAGLLALLAPIAAVALVGLPRAAAPHAAGAIFAWTVVIYCIGEELGWRGWLFDSLGGLPLWQSAAVTALLWFVWHFTFLPDLRQPIVALQFALGILIGSIGLAQATARGRSVGVAAGWHAAVKLLITPPQIGLMLALVAAATWANRGRTK